MCKCVTTEILEEALVGCDPEGPLCELLFFFLSAIFQALAEEQEEVARDQVAEADTKGQEVTLGHGMTCRTELVSLTPETGNTSLCILYEIDHEIQLHI